MITKSKQSWQVGTLVKVGFLTLRVECAIPTPGDGLPDQYILTNLAGDKLYAFTPHNGCRSIDVDEAEAMLAAAERHAARVAAEAAARASQSRSVRALFDRVVVA